MRSRSPSGARSRSRRSHTQFSPTAWHDWVAFLVASPGGAEWIALRLPIAAALAVFAARTNRAWLVPVAVWLALPVIYINSWVVLLGAIRLWHERSGQPPTGHKTSRDSVVA